MDKISSVSDHQHNVQLNKVCNYAFIGPDWLKAHCISLLSQGMSWRSKLGGTQSPLTSALRQPCGHSRQRHLSPIHHLHLLQSLHSAVSAQCGLFMVRSLHSAVSPQCGLSVVSAQHSLYTLWSLCHLSVASLWRGLSTV